MWLKIQICIRMNKIKEFFIVVLGIGMCLLILMNQLSIVGSRFDALYDKDRHFIKVYDINAQNFSSLVYQNSLEVEESNENEEDPRNNMKNVKIVLYWTKKWINDNFLGKGFFPQDCPENRCFFTNDTSKLNVSDALIMHMNNFHEVPPYRLPHQLYVVMANEPPYHLRKKVEKYHLLFNVTWSYQSDSDIFLPIGKTASLTEEEKKEVAAELPVDFAKNKTNLVFWVVSNCHAQSGRDWVGEEMQKYIPVDIFGKCGNQEYIKKEGERYVELDFQKLHRDYKFYLAFENDMCKDYMTEKVWRTLKSKHTVPIVLGGGNYKRDLPPHSFIDVHDFSSIKELTDYIKLLDKNDTLYNEYFAWKKEYKILLHNRVVKHDAICEFCKFLHEMEGKTKIIPDLREWFGVKAACLNKTEYYKDIKDAPWGQH